MPVPWKLIGALLRFVVPTVPEIIATVKTLKKEQQREKMQVDDTALRLQELEQRIAAQLQLIEQLTNQIVTLEKVVAWTTWTALFALVLALIALGVVFLK
ncbi:MAG: hypothetical protein E6K64_06030 [Nitrospirae bacterium]|nr:MAG: hypothetical protein E6K64_06030 [Nitrospirota bacterium]